MMWTFQSLDPTTKQPPTDPAAGFLPPGTGGSVFFTVMPKTGLATGTQIQNQASIVFDFNAAIPTPTWLNTLDNAAPASKISALAPTQSSINFPVVWSGTDAGAGVQDFTVYVADNGAPFTAWLTKTTAIQSTYTGITGHTYGFYSIARDLVGNIEAPKNAAEATTKVSADTTPPVIAPQITGTLGNNGWYRSAVSVTWSVTDPESGITTSSGCTATNLTADTVGTTLTCSATDGAGLSTSVSVTIKIDQTPPVAVATVTPPPNASGWNYANVTVSFTGTDNLSGINSCSAPVNLTSEVAGQIASGTCTDNAGNVSAPVSAKVNIDKTAPNISGMPAPGCSLWPPNGKMVQVATVTAADALSGLAPGSFQINGTSNEPPSSSEISITPNGSGGYVIALQADRSGNGTGRIYTLTATANDLAGNTATVTATCTVPHDQGN